MLVAPGVGILGVRARLRVIMGECRKSRHSEAYFSRAWAEWNDELLHSTGVKDDWNPGDRNDSPKLKEKL